MRKKYFYQVLRGQRSHKLGGPQLLLPTEEIDFSLMLKMQSRAHAPKPTAQAGLLAPAEALSEKGGSLGVPGEAWGSGFQPFLVAVVLA